jgi:serine protease
VYEQAQRIMRMMSLLVLSVVMPSIHQNAFAYDTPKPALSKHIRLIVSVSDSTVLNSQTSIDEFVQHLSAFSSLELQVHRVMSGAAVVVSTQLPNEISRSVLMSKLESSAHVKSVSLDAVVKPSAKMDESSVLYEQWQLTSNLEHKSALNMQPAWDLTQGSPDVVVAIIDTGIHYDHPDLLGRVLPGYDFVSPMSDSVEDGIHVPSELEFLRANDGNGRDADATDPGDAVDQHTMERFASLGVDCLLSNSSWHGTAMASIVAANANDGIGMTGIDWHAKILPVRAIGKCGGRRSDLLDAIRWAAGVKDPALPENPHPARIINLSLGIDDLCTAADQHAINEATAAGAVIVAAVGNNGRNTDAQPSSPSHCRDVIGVMAVDRHGFRAEYSNVGRDADIAAPGGDATDPKFGIKVATNQGYAESTALHSYRQSTGTSVATPHVSGVLALMLSLKPTLTNQELQALLLDNISTFTEAALASDNEQQACTPELCGSGILNAGAAIIATANHQPGTYLDSPSLAAAQSSPVSVGSFNGFGCTVTTLQTVDPSLTALVLYAMLMLFYRYQFSKQARCIRAHR